MPPHDRSDPGSGSGPPKYPGTFLLAFREAAAGMKWQIRQWLGHLVQCIDEEGGEHVIGLENLYRRARREPREEWPVLIAEFLCTAKAATKDENLPADLATVADQLLVRLGQPLPAMPDEAKVWSQPLADTGLDINLVVDYSNRMCYVTQKLVNDSGRPGSEWLERAIATLRSRTPADCLQTIDEESGMRLCAVGDAYDSSRSLLLETLLPDAANDGCFVAIPGRDQLFVLPVSLQAVSSIHLMKLMAEQHYKSTPYPISDKVFWVQGGVWRLFPIDVRDKQANIDQPEEFAEILKRLTPADEESSSDGGHEP